jgi:hypothetical protein
MRDFFAIRMVIQRRRRVVHNATKDGAICSSAPASGSKNALDSGDTFKIAQIKDKLGTLRFYWDGKLWERAKVEIKEAIALANAGSDLSRTT